ncbi:uncharacterized protein LOC124930156 [Impatiens glandulifera]|uniref:uncharacterized protein LOC124930156 n=1 Tax=Impatiens glandulifera TaxID=253017 RepID=UPI001FB06470|nr:uncharacterized protein LOC124930156 [Impatiens glandulifera]
MSHQYSTNYAWIANKFYRRSFGGQNMLCIDNLESKRIIEEVHVGTCGLHVNGMTLTKKILRLRYYWQNLKQEYVNYVRIYHQCQIYANLKHTPASLLYNMISPWSFSTWGITIIGKIYPHASNRNEFILVAIDYFTKWVDVVSYKVLKSSQVPKFIRTSIIARYGFPDALLSNNGRHYQGKILQVLDEFKIEHHKSSPHRPPNKWFGRSGKQKCD